MTDAAEPELARVLLLVPTLAVLGGLVAGVVGGAFRWLLERAELWRDHMVEWSHGISAVGWLIPVAVCALTAASAATISKFVPRAAGSGIQHVEAVDRGESDPPPLIVVPARFIGGILSIGTAGLVLGREGPTVHMAAAIGAAVGRVSKLAMDEIRLLQTVLSGAGLAVAFNAPFGGALFVFEEITKKFRLREGIATFLAVAVGVGCSQLIVGDSPDFVVDEVAVPPLQTLPIFLVFGILVGALGVAYTRAVMACMDTYAAITRIPGIVKAGVIGAVIGVALFVDPLVAGGGDGVSQLILAGHQFAFPVVIAYLAVRFILGPVCYAAGTPGGLFAPMLALGALAGVLFSRIAGAVVPDLDADLTVALAIVGMSTLFAAVVRAPFTGIVIVVEMTAITSVTVPMLAAGACAVVVATVLRSPPLYDTLRERMLRADATPRT
ncbi:MAG: ClC family H(+)/Cl(-) exchange transporter [Mycobacterium sp.]